VSEIFISLRDMLLVLLSTGDWRWTMLDLAAIRSVVPTAGSSQPNVKISTPYWTTSTYRSPY